MITPRSDIVLGRGVYGAAEALRLINFRRQYEASARSISRKTIARWLRGYDYSRNGITHHSDPLWRPDYVNEDNTIELSFRDLIELRFVKAFRDVGLSLPTIRECFMRAVEAVNDQPILPAGDAVMTGDRFDDGNTHFKKLRAYLGGEQLPESNFSPLFEESKAILKTC
jgi:hypothetical protein